MAGPIAENVIVFGPAGGVGRSVAREARQLGSHVWLAMRDVNKPIPGLKNDGTDEGYTRIQADLSKPETVKKAVQESKATSAFFYQVFTGGDFMRKTVQAMKDGGIKYIVFLSTLTVQGSAHNPGRADYIVREMAGIEITLEECGVPFAAVRPGYFNSNLLWYAEGIKKGEVELLSPEQPFDFLAPEDIGAVAGTFAAKPDPDRPTSTYLCGPRLMDQFEGYRIIGKALGKDIKLIPVTPEQFYEERKGTYPDDELQSILLSVNNTAQYYEGIFEDATKNVERITGRPSIPLHEWAATHLS